MISMYVVRDYNNLQRLNNYRINKFYYRRYNIVLLLYLILSYCILYSFAIL